MNSQLLCIKMSLEEPKSGEENETTGIKVNRFIPIEKGELRVRTLSRKQQIEQGNVRISRKGGLFRGAD